MSAQTQEATLIVTGSGATEEEATGNALRSAIAQTYGVFVSSNTQVVNDEIVKDEIAAVTSGNIKEYREISHIDLPDGRREVTLQATVCISNLIAYAEANGFHVEFAGPAFAGNMRLKELNKINEENIVASTMDLAKELYFRGYDYEIQVCEPRYNLRTVIEEEKQKSGGRIFNPLTDEQNDDNQYGMEAIVTAIPNSNALNAYNMIWKTLQSVSLDEHEREEYDRLGCPYYSVVVCRTKCQEELSVDSRLYFRSEQSVDEMKVFFNRDFNTAMLNFGIDTEAGMSVLKIVAAKVSQLSPQLSRLLDPQTGSCIYEKCVPYIFTYDDRYDRSYVRFWADSGKLMFIKGLLCLDTECCLKFPQSPARVRDTTEDYAFLIDFDDRPNRIKVLLGIPRDAIGKISTMEIKRMEYEQN